MTEPRLLSKTMPELLPQTDRTPDVPHVSEVINDLCLRQGMYTGDQDTDTRSALWALGSAWEHAVIERYHRDDPDRWLVPAEIELDGMHGHPDLYDCDHGAPTEIKCTWASVRTADEDPAGSEKLWRYWVQLKAYCWMMGARTGRLEVVFVNGYWSFDRGHWPEYRLWEWTWTQSELEANWRMLTSHAEEMYG